MQKRFAKGCIKSKLVIIVKTVLCESLADAFEDWEVLLYRSKMAKNTLRTTATHPVSVAFAFDRSISITDGRSTSVTAAACVLCNALAAATKRPSTLVWGSSVHVIKLHRL